MDSKRKGKGKAKDGALVSVQLLRIRRLLEKKNTMNKYQKSIQDQVRTILSEFPSSTLDMTLLSEENYVLLQRFAQGRELTEEELPRAKTDYDKRRKAYVTSLLTKEVDQEGTEEYWRNLFDSMARVVNYVVEQQKAADDTHAELPPKLRNLLESMGDGDASSDDESGADGGEGQASGAGRSAMAVSAGASAASAGSAREGDSMASSDGVVGQVTRHLFNQVMKGYYEDGTDDEASHSDSGGPRQSTQPRVQQEKQRDGAQGAQLPRLPDLAKMADPLAPAGQDSTTGKAGVAKPVTEGAREGAKPY